MKSPRAICIMIAFCEMLFHEFWYIYSCFIIFSYWSGWWRPDSQIDQNVECFLAIMMIFLSSCRVVYRDLHAARSTRVTLISRVLALVVYFVGMGYVMIGTGTTSFETLVSSCVFSILMRMFKDFTRDNQDVDGISDNDKFILKFHKMKTSFEIRLNMYESTSDSTKKQAILQLFYQFKNSSRIQFNTRLDDMKTVMQEMKYLMNIAILDTQNCLNGTIINDRDIVSFSSYHKNAKNF